jgi:hypothetical protein
MVYHTRGEPMIYHTLEGSILTITSLRRWYRSKDNLYLDIHTYNYSSRGRRGTDCIVVGSMDTYAICAYDLLSCEFEPRSW